MMSDDDGFMPGDDELPPDNVIDIEYLRQFSNKPGKPGNGSGDYAPNGKFDPDTDATMEPVAVYDFPTGITIDEWDYACIAPPCIVEDLIFQDISLLSAGGGTGKTTVMLYESIHVILGRDLYGRKILRPGPVMLLSAEDPRGTLVARAREICRAMNLTDEETQQVREGLLIKDHSSEIFRLTEVSKDVIEISLNTGLLIEAINAQSESDVGKPTLVIFDPLISFGTGEARVNDAEQGIIMACRKIIALTGVGVQLVHHIGQVASREKTVDSYAARGGTALPDGCRTVRVLHTVEPESMKIPPSLTGSQIMCMHCPKTTYAQPQPDIYISRDGWVFDFAEPAPEPKKSDVAKEDQGKILDFIRDGLHRNPPERWSKNTLESQTEILGMKRPAIRAAVDVLLATNRLSWAATGAQRGMKTYLSTEVH